MIPCQKCQYQNPLGTLFCHNCGTKLQVDASQIFGSIQETQRSQAHEKIFNAGKSILTIGLFGLAAAISIRLALVPSIPAPTVPQGDLRDADALFPSETDWRESTARIEDDVDWPTPAAPIDQSRLLSWRRAVASQLLDGFGIDFARLRQWQLELVALQERSGAFPGKDATAATALGCLALQAFPGDEQVDLAANKAREHLRRQRDYLQSGSGSDLAVALSVMALYESDGAIALQGLHHLLVNGKLPRWQMLALCHLAPEDRIKEFPAIRLSTPETPVAQAMLSILHGPDDPERTLGDELMVAGLDPVDQLLWSHWQWLRIGDLEVYAGALQDWSRLTSLPPAPPDLSLLTGAGTDYALAILTCTAPASVPVRWHAPTAR